MFVLTLILTLIPGWVVVNLRTMNQPRARDQIGQDSPYISGPTEIIQIS